MKGKNTIELPCFGIHTIEIVSAYPLLVSNDQTPIIAHGSGRTKYVYRYQDGNLHIDPTEPKAEYDIIIKSRRTQVGEETDDLPPPEPAPANSYLAKLRQKVRDSMGNTREAFAEFKSIYEVVDDLDTFEEEREARAQAQKEASEASKDKTGGDTPKKEEQASEAGSSASADG